MDFNQSQLSSNGTIFSLQPKLDINLTLASFVTIICLFAIIMHMIILYLQWTDEYQNEKPLLFMCLSFSECIDSIRLLLYSWNRVFDYYKHVAPRPIMHILTIGKALYLMSMLLFTIDTLCRLIHDMYYDEQRMKKIQKVSLAIFLVSSTLICVTLRWLLREDAMPIFFHLLVTGIGCFIIGTWSYMVFKIQRNRISHVLVGFTPQTETITIQNTGKRNISKASNKCGTTHTCQTCKTSNTSTCNTRNTSKTQSMKRSINTCNINNSAVCDTNDHIRRCRSNNDVVGTTEHITTQSNSYCSKPSKLQTMIRSIRNCHHWLLSASALILLTYIPFVFLPNLVRLVVRSNLCDIGRLSLLMLTATEYVCDAFIYFYRTPRVRRRIKRKLTLWRYC